MRVLILSQWFSPEPPGSIIQELGQMLQEFGHDVVVLTGFPNYPAGKLYPGYRIKVRQKEVIAGVPVVRVPLYPYHGRSGLGRAFNFLSFAVCSSILGPLSVPKPDVMFVYDSPAGVGIPAVLLSRLWGVHFVYQIQDMWPETLAATGMLGNQRFIGAIGKFTNWIYRHASEICVISPGFRANLLTKGVPAEKIHVISNWVDADLYRPVSRNEGLAQSLGLAGKFNIIFAGNMGKAQALDTVLDAAGLLRDLADCQLVLVGDGVAYDDLLAQANRSRLDNVRFLGRFPASEMANIYALADVLLVHLKDDPLFRITIPHKTLSYMATGKPILMATAGDAADMVLDAKAGIACPPQNPLALADAIRQLFALSPAERDELGQNGRQYIESGYTLPLLAHKIEDVLRAAVVQ